MRPQIRDELLRYSFALVATACALVVTLPLIDFLEHSPSAFFYVAVLLSAWFGGLGPGLLATLLSVLAIDYFLVEPRFALDFRLEDFVRFCVFILVAFVISALTAERKRAEDTLRKAHGELKDVLDSKQQLLHERTQALTALEESESRFRGAFDHAAIGMALIGPDGRWLRVNRSLCDMLGATEGQLLAGNFSDNRHPEDLETDFGYIWRTLAEGAPHLQMEKRLVSSPGATLWMSLTFSLVRDSDNRPLYFVVQFQDNTVRKRRQEELLMAREDLAHHVKDRTARLARANEELRQEISERKLAEDLWQQSEEQFRLLVHGTTEYAIIMVDPAGKVITWNNGAEKMFGYREEEMIGESFAALFPADDRRQSKHTQALSQAEADGRYEQEGPHLRKDGGLLNAHGVISPLRDEEGQLKGFSIIMRETVLAG